MKILDVGEVLLANLKFNDELDYVFKGLEKREEGYERVQFMTQYLLKYKIIQRILKKVPLKSKKSDNMANFQMISGDEGTTKFNVIYAMDCYNKSLCYSAKDFPFGSIYVRRSGLLYSWKRYEHCILSLNVAEKNVASKFLLARLDQRRAFCEAEMQEEDFQHEPPVMLDPFFNASNPNRSFILKNEEGLGRYLCTETNLRPGDLIVSEKPFCSVLSKQDRYRRCDRCQAHNFFCLIPCKNCCTTMFCSERCEYLAQRSYHKFECAIIDLLLTIFDGCHLLALRTTLMIISEFPNFHEIMAFCHDKKNYGKTYLDIDSANLSVKEHYLAVHGLETDDQIRSIHDIFDITLVTSILFYFVLRFTPLQGLLSGFLINEKRFFCDLLYYHVQISFTNSMYMGFEGYDGELTNRELHGYGLYPFISLMNHSCNPNAFRICNESQSHVFAIRPIAEDEPIYINYGMHYRYVNRTERRKYLFNRYNFYCECEACVNNYPVINNLQPWDNVANLYKGALPKRLDKYDFNFALSEFPKYRKFMQDNGHTHPSLQINICEMMFEKAIRVLVDSVPFEFRMRRREDLTLTYKKYRKLPQPLNVSPVSETNEDQEKAKKKPLRKRLLNACKFWK